MVYNVIYKSPLGNILIETNENYLTGLRFCGDEEFPSVTDFSSEGKYPSVLHQTKKWLNIYFSGREPDFIPPLKPVGTPFQLAVWKRTTEIPYAKTATYKDVAKDVSENGKMSARAVGTALGKNKIAIIIPCHRVIGANGDMKGYAWGIDKKISLLKLEQK